MTKTQTNVSRQSHSLPQPQSQHSSSHLPQPHQSVKSGVAYNSVDYERLSKEAETERWMAYVHHQQQQQQQQHQQQQQQQHQQHQQQQQRSQHQLSQHQQNQNQLQQNHAVAMARHKSNEMRQQSHHLQSSMINESSKGSHSLPSTTSPVMEASKPLMTNRAKTEPSFSLYGYQPNQSISYITPAQLKENNRLNMSSNVTMGSIMTGRSDMSKVCPPAAHGLERRESPKMDRSVTPNSRNSTPIGRPPSLSPKTKSPKMMAPDRISPLYHRTQNQAIKQYDFSMSNAPPAHQNSSSRSGTPLLSSSPISLSNIQSQIPVAHSSQTQEQPQNLVKSDSKGKFTMNELNKSQMEMQRESPKSAANMPASYQSFSLIQQGLVPNPLYKPSPTTQSVTKTSSMPSVITRPPLSTQVTPHKTPSPSLSPHMSQKFPKPGPGIVSGIPICRPNSIPYYGSDPTVRTNVMNINMNAQKYPQQMSAMKSDPINTYPELNRMAKLPNDRMAHSTPSPHSSQSPHSAHSPFNPTPERNVSVFHRMAPSPHSPRLSTGSVPQSPYGPAPGMVAVSSPIGAPVAQSHATPPAAHSGANAYTGLNVKRKSIESIASSLTNENSGDSSYSNKKLKVLESATTGQPSDIAVSTVNIINSLGLNREMVSSDANTRNIDVNQTSVVSAPEVKETTDFMSKHQKAMSVANRPSNTESVIPVTQSQTPLEALVPPVSAATVESTVSATATPVTVPSTASTSSFHPKLKKAWLQRHSEDKTISTTNTNTSVANNNTMNNSAIKNISESSNTSSESSGKDSVKSKPEPNVNGGLDRKAAKEEDSINDETTSASEAEMSNSSKGSKRKAQTSGVRTRKRMHQNKDKESKKRKSNSEDSLKIGKENEDKKKREKGKDSDKESSDTRSTTRRGRKPKGFKSEDKDKSSKESSSSLKKKVPKGKSDRTAIIELKKTGAHFLQGGSCVEVAPKLPKCRECRMTPTQRNRKPTIFCRFYDYRKLAFKNNILTIAGFSQPQDATEEDLKLWLPSEDSPSDIDVETAKFVITHVGDQFCDLVKQEKEAQLLHMGSSNKNITWKRVVQGVREMCDVCETTLFNIHWVCDKCGFVVCIDCYKARKVGSIKEEQCPAKDRDGFQWLLCNNRQQHEPKKLEVTQIIAASALSSVGRMLHNVRTKWNISSNCSCVAMKDINHKMNGFTKGVLSVVKIDNKQVNGVNDTNSKNWKAINGIKPETDPSLTGFSSESGHSPLSFFVDVALTSEKLIPKTPANKEEVDQKSKKKIKIESEQNSDGDDDNKHSTLRELLMGPTTKPTKEGSGKPNGSPVSDTQTTTNKKCNQSNESNDLPESEVKDENSVKVESQNGLQHFHRRYFPLRKEADPLPVIRRNIEETKKLYPQIPHSWFSDGRLLVLHEPKNSDNMTIFQEQWIRGQVCH